MNKLNNESKVMITIVSITIIFIIVVLFQTGSFEKIFKKYKKDNLVKCTSSIVEGTVNYKNISCTITDEFNKVYTINYPEFSDNALSFKILNASFKDNYNKIIKEIEYHEDEEINKLQIYKLNELNYRVINYLDYLFIIDIRNTLLDNGYRYDYQYNINIINLKTKQRVTENEFRNSITISSNLSSNIRKTVFDIYNTKFKYNLDYETERNEKIDEFYDQLSFSNIQTFYYDSTGRLSFILYLYDINKNKEVPYFFKANSTGDVTYSEYFS